MMDLQNTAIELQVDGLVGPTHNFSGLSFGNIASSASAGKTSNPRAAALEGLEKMALVAGLGVAQALLPPHPRPAIGFLRKICGGKTIAETLERAHTLSPTLLAAAWSSSPMWTANAATVFPSSDTADHRLHLVVANLHTQFHRTIESTDTAWLLTQLLPDQTQVQIHPPLSAHAALSDEGAANQMRLSSSHGTAGVHVLVYGRDDAHVSTTTKYPARQSLLASRSVAALGQLSTQRALFVQQSPAAIDAGAFHNDVVAVANENLLLTHDQAFTISPKILADQLSNALGSPIHCLTATTAELPLAEAIRTYLFNSQLLTTPGGMVLVAPEECRNSPQASAVIDRWLAAGTPLKEVRYVAVRQSMSNGGGPACLRLRIPLTTVELARVNAGLTLTPDLKARLQFFINQNYPETITTTDLRDSSLARRCLEATEGLHRLLQIPAPQLEA